MKDRIEKLSFFEGQLMLTSMEIADLVSEEEMDLENLNDENKIAIIKDRVEKYEEILMHLDEAEGMIRALLDQLEDSQE